MTTSDKFLQSLLDKLDKVSGTQNQMLVEIAEIKRDIAHHIKRTDLAEETIQLIRKEAADQSASLANDIKPVKKHVAMMEGGLKLLGIVSLLVGLAVGLIKIFKS